MTEGSGDDERLLKEYGVRRVDASYNINSGRLEEVELEILDPGIPDERWWSVVYDVDLGEAKIKLLPDIRDPSDLAHVLTRSDAAVLKLDPIEGVVTWQEVFMRDYGNPEIEVDERAEALIPQNMGELVDQFKFDLGSENEDS